jgi:hypothetical protein
MFILLIIISRGGGDDDWATASPPPHLPLYIDYERRWLWMCSVYVPSSILKMENIVKYFITCK